MRFVFYDVISAFLFGVPPLAEYGYGSGHDFQQHNIEWMHGIPVEFLYVISQINSWKAGSRSGLDDWQTLESHVLAWKSRNAPLDIASPSEVANIERATVQEAWRHVLLIYIYMVIPLLFYISHK
jgi:hypothetical protein